MYRCDCGRELFLPYVEDRECPYCGSDDLMADAVSSDLLESGMGKVGITWLCDNCERKFDALHHLGEAIMVEPIHEDEE